MTFTLTINCDNDAFHEDPNAEVARVLHETANRVISGDLDLPYGMATYNRTIYDINGNDIGRATYKR